MKQVLLPQYETKLGWEEIKDGHMRGERKLDCTKRGGGAGRGVNGGCDFPRGLESLNGKFNGAFHSNHKSQEGGKRFEDRNARRVQGGIYSRPLL